MSLFRINWIFIAEIVVVLLILFLICIEVYKEISRWRKKFSNQNLKIRILKLNDIIDNKPSIFINKIKLISNTNSDNQHNRPIILFLRTNYRKILPNILIEGLASYGYNIVNIRLKKKLGSTINNYNKELEKHLLGILRYLFQNKITTSEKFYVLNYSKSNFPYGPFLVENNNVGMILINPRLNNTNIINIDKIISNNNIKNKLWFIFSNYSYLIFPNFNLKKFNRLYKEKINYIRNIHIQKARISFKYYETILLGNIIQFLDNYKD